MTNRTAQFNEIYTAIEKLDSDIIKLDTKLTKLENDTTYLSNAIVYRIKIIEDRIIALEQSQKELTSTVHELLYNFGKRNTIDNKSEKADK